MAGGRARGKLGKGTGLGPGKSSETCPVWRCLWREERGRGKKLLPSRYVSEQDLVEIFSSFQGPGAKWQRGWRVGIGTGPE